MSRLLAPSTIALWVIDLLYVLIDLLLPTATRIPESVQDLAFIATLAVTTAWIVRHRGLEYRLGYHDGRADAEKYKHT